MSGDFTRRELVEAIDDAYSLYTQLYSELFNGAGDMDESLIPADKKRIANEFLYAMEHVDDLLEEVKMHSGVQSMPEGHIDLFRGALSDARTNVNRILSQQSPGLEELVDPDGEGGHGSEDKSVSELLVEVFALVDDHGDFTADEIKMIQKVIFAGFMEPDIWLRNLKEIDPVLGADAERRLPGSIRVRIQEIFRSYVTGNYLSAIALSRATLEYAIVDRANHIQIVPYMDDPKRPNRVRPVGQLVEETAEKIPRIRGPLEAIVQSGNQTLHPKKKERLALHPTLVKEMAKVSINAIQEVTESLYL